MSESKAFKAEISFAATADEIMAFDKVASKDSDPMDRKAAELMADLKLSVAISADKPLKDLDSLKGGDVNSLGQDPGFDSAFALSGKSGKTFADIRMVDGNLFLKADIEGIAEMADEDASQVKGLAREFPKVVQDAVAGKWISVEGKMLKEFVDKASKGAGAGAAAPAMPSVDPKVAGDLLITVKDVINRNVTFEDKGKQDGADHIYVAAPAKAFADDLLKSLKPALKGIPGLPLDEFPTAAPTDIPDKKIGVDVFVKDGFVSSVVVDLAQFDQDLPADAHLPMKVAFSKDADAAPTAPEGATKFTMADFEEIVGMMMGSKSSSKSKSKVGSTPAAKLTDAQIKELTAAGIPEAQVKLLSQSGMSYAEIKELLGAGS